jgi:hypothetical protein
MPTYNVFRAKGFNELCCAVTEAWPVPAFVTDAGWSFGGKLDEGAGPRGFDPAVAEAGVRFNGFYLFQMV